MFYHLNSSTPSTSPSFILTCHGLGKRFNREWIFRRLDFTFQSGNVYAITGPNGSGKSTLLQILWGQSPPTTGTLSYQKDNTVIPVEDVYNHISIATPYMDLIDEFTLQEQLEFHFKMKSMRNQISIDELIEQMFLTDARDKFIGNFSSGMRQRVKLGLAFYTEADVIFLDEPGTNLDKQNFEWYLTQLQNRDKSVIVIIASNNPEEYIESTDQLNITQFK